MSNPAPNASPAPEAIRDEFRAIARVVRDALLMIVRFLESRYLK